MKSRRQCHNERMQLKHSAKYEMCKNEHANKDNSDNAIAVLTTEVKTTNKTKNVSVGVASTSTLIEITSRRFRRYSRQL